MFKTDLLRTEEVARLTGLTVKTLYQYRYAGIFPEPRERIAQVAFYDRRDVAAFMEGRKGRPGARKAVKRSAS